MGPEEWSRELWTGQPHVNPREGGGANNQGDHLQTYKEKKVTKSSLHGYVKGKSHITNLITVYNEMTGLVDEGKIMDVVHLNSSKGFDTIISNIPRQTDGIEECRWVEHWLKCQAQTVMITGTMSSWRVVVTTTLPLRLILSPVLFYNFTGWANNPKRIWESWRMSRT